MLAAPAAQADTDPFGAGPAPVPVDRSTAGPAPELTADQQAIVAARSTAKATGKPAVVDALTTETSQTLVNPNGTLTTTASAQPVRTKQGKTWSDLDATLRGNPDGSLSPAVASTGLTLSGGGTGPMATLTTRDGKTLSVTFPFALPKPTLSGPTATYHGVLRPDVDLQVTALPNGGWRDVIIVRTAEAAADPALKKLRFPISTTGGLTTTTDAEGRIALKDETGAVRINAATPYQWDSSTSAPQAPAAAKSRGAASLSAAAADNGAPPADRSTAEAPGTAAVVSKIAVAADSTGIELTPDATTFGKGTGPWYLDPTISVAGSTQAYAQVQEYNPGSSYTSNMSSLGVGYCGYSDCSGRGRERIYYQIGIPAELRTKPNGAPSLPTIYGSTLYTTVTSAASPGTQVPLGVYLAGGIADGGAYGTINGGTNWNNQPCNGGGTMGGCSKIASPVTTVIGNGPVNYDVTNAVREKAGWSWTSWIIGIAPDDESNKLYRQHYSTNPYVVTNYDLAPSIWWPRTSPTPGTASDGKQSECTSGGAYPWTNPGWVGANQNITLTASNWSPANMNLHTVFRMWDDNDSSFGFTGDSGWAGSWNPNGVSVNVGSLSDGHQYGWTANAYDADPPSQGLGSTETPWCYFRVDKTPPTVSVTSTDFPPVGTPNPTPSKYSSDAGTFTLSGTDPDPAGGPAGGHSGLACFRWTTNSTPATGWRCDDSRTGVANNVDTGVVPASQGSFTFTPGRWGTNILYVQAQDNAGNYSQPVAYAYYAPWKPGSLPMFGDLTGDGKPDILVPDATGKLLLVQPSLDPSTAVGISGTDTVAPGGQGWKNVQITHRGSLRGNANADELIAHPPGDPFMYLYQNNGHGVFSTRVPFLKNGKTSGAAPVCQDADGVPLPGGCPADFGGGDWSTTTQILAIGTPEGEYTKDATGQTVLTRTSLLAVIGNKLWLFPPGTTIARLLNGTDKEVSTGDWSNFDLIGPGPANGNTGTDADPVRQPTLWARDRGDGRIHAYPITRNADGSTNYSALADPTKGTIIGTGFTAAQYPTVGSSGDISGKGLADLWTLSPTGALQLWPGVNGSSVAGRVTGFATPPVFLGTPGGKSIKNSYSNRCLLAYSSNNVNGAPAVQGDCNPNYADQIWEFNDVAGGGYQIRNKFSNRCLVVYANNSGNGAPAAQNDCNSGYADQVWNLDPVTGGGYLIRNKFSNRCLVVLAANNNNGAPATQYDCNAGWADQVWRF
ncbi:RICIN domain-containing protein [Kitasatospora sp. NPDC056783]|uniref:RICIN domain-containing protein n=1 Tax=Kitasatospora sp. NPDC056783 TaxID=3345943 RepID=UPI003698B2C0